MFGFRGSAALATALECFGDCGGNARASARAPVNQLKPEKGGF